MEDYCNFLKAVILTALAVWVVEIALIPLIAPGRPVLTVSVKSESECAVCNAVAEEAVEEVVDEEAVAE